MDRKYAKDYEEIKNPYGPSGKEKRFRYKGNYYVWNCKKGRKHFLAESAVYCLLSAVLWVAAGMVNNPGMRFFLTEIPYVLALWALFYLVRGVFSMFQVKTERLERVQYETSVRRAEHSTIGLLTILILSTLGEGIFCIRNFSEADWKKELLFLGITLLEMICSLCYMKIQKENTCTEEKGAESEKGEEE